MLQSLSGSCLALVPYVEFLVRVVWVVSVVVLVEDIAVLVLLVVVDIAVLALLVVVGIVALASVVVLDLAVGVGQVLVVVGIAVLVEAVLVAVAVLAVLSADLAVSVSVVHQGMPFNLSPLLAVLEA